MESKEFSSKNISMSHYLNKKPTDAGRKHDLLCRIRGFLSANHKQFYTPEYNDAQSDESPQTFRRRIPLQSSGKKSKPTKKLV
jgi:hypothetical protein